MIRSQPIVAFPIMMGACNYQFLLEVCGYQIRQLFQKNHLVCFHIWVIGVFVAAYIVKSLDVSALQWLIVIVLYSAITMLVDIRKNKPEEIGVTQSHEDCCLE